MEKEIAAVSCRGVTKRYITGSSQVLALRGIDLDARTGELLIKQPHQQEIVTVFFSRLIV